MSVEKSWKKAHAESIATMVVTLERKTAEKSFKALHTADPYVFVISSLMNESNIVPWHNRLSRLTSSTRPGILFLYFIEIEPIKENYLK